MVGVQVALGGLEGLVAEDSLEHVQGDAGVGHPGRPGVAEAVPGEVFKTEALPRVVPAGGVADGRGVRTPPRGPRRSGSSGSLSAVRRSRMGSSASRIGTMRARRPLVCLTTRPPLPG